MDSQTTREGSQPADGDADSPMDALRDAARHLGEAKEYASNFLAAKVDATKLSFRRAVMMIGFFVIAGITGAGVLITAAVLLTNGIATGIGNLFDPAKVWLGQIIVGLLVIIAANVGVYLLIRSAMRASRDKTVQKYETRHNEQRRRYGHDVTTANVSSGTADVAAG
ncbi:MAG: phage holin family protein [Anaerolineae bacterium]|nr:phage holin family protein [Phycisphaerae bacterium]